MLYILSEPDTSVTHMHLPFGGNLRACDMRWSFFVFLRDMIWSLTVGRSWHKDGKLMVAAGVEYLYNIWHTD